MRSVFAWASLVLAVGATAAPAHMARVSAVGQRELTDGVPFRFSYNGTTSFLAFRASDGILVTTDNEEDRFKFIATSSNYLGTEEYLKNGSSNKTSSYYGVLKSVSTGKCLKGRYEPLDPGDDEPFLSSDCSWSDNESQALQTFRAVFHSGVSGGNVRFAQGSPVKATITFTGAYPGMPTTNYYASGNETGQINYNVQINEGQLILG